MKVTKRQQPPAESHKQSNNQMQTSTMSSVSTKNRGRSITPYAKVNASSRNRREVQRAARDKTPDSSNTRKSYQHQYHPRVTFKMTVEPSGDPIASIRGTLKDLLRELSQIDSSIAILPWRSNTTLDQLHTNSVMPTTVTATYKYMHKLFVPKKGEQSTVYPHIQLGHDIDFSTI